jgi:predicted ferric reductase
MGIILVVLAAGILACSCVIALQTHTGEIAEFGRTWALVVTVGKIFGLLAGAIVFLQFPLSVKVKILDRVFGLHRLLLGHRFLGVAAAVFASLHPLFIFAPKARKIGALRLEIFPELL